MTEREGLLAVFHAITGLAERLTGEKLTVCVETEDGQLMVYGGNVQWSSFDKDESLQE